MRLSVALFSQGLQLRMGTKCKHMRSVLERGVPTVVVQSILQVIEVQQLVPALADEVQRVLEQSQERLEWTQDMCTH